MYFRWVVGGVYYQHGFAVCGGVCVLQFLGRRAGVIFLHLGDVLVGGVTQTIIFLSIFLTLGLCFPRVGCERCLCTFSSLNGGPLALIMASLCG